MIEERQHKNRVRKNILKHLEAQAVSWLCPRLPKWVKPDLLTGFGFVGSTVVFFGLYFGQSSRLWLLLSVAGLIMHWFGDSLDGRLAYYRNTPRKWYGFSLDVLVDWSSASIMALGFYLYLPLFKLIALLFVAAYGGSMIIALLRYRVVDQYIIDSFALGPTELRIFLATILLLEIFLPMTLLYAGAGATLLHIVANTLESYRLLLAADQRDRREQACSGGQVTHPHVM